MTTLQMGSSGPDGMTLQQTLKGRGFDPGNIDGQFERGTEAAVLAFQKSEGLYSDGIGNVSPRIDREHQDESTTCSPFSRRP